MKPHTLKQIGEWLIEGQTGASSLAMCAVYLGAREVRPFNLNHPLDPSDFRRCMLFLSILPEEDRQPLLGEMAALTLHWKTVRDNWSTLEELYKAAQSNGDGKSLYAKMKDLGL